MSETSLLSSTPETPALSQLVFGHCCICGNLDVTPIAVGEDFEYHSCVDSFVMVQCNRCKLVFLNPRPSRADLDVINPPNYHAYGFTAQNYGFVYSVRNRLEAKRLLQVCSDLKPDARILDIGCGDGFHLDLLRRFGKPSWSLEGLDASPVAVAHACRRGLHVQQGFIEDSTLPQSSYDLILLIATIEHVENPRTFLRAARDLLAPDGRILIVTDNVGSLSFPMWKDRHWGGYHFPRHFNLFTKDTLRKLAFVSGFTPERLDTLTTPVNWVYSIRNFVQDMGAPPWLIEQFSLKTPVSLGVFTIFDYFLNCLGQGGLLRMTLKKNTDDRLE